MRFKELPKRWKTQIVILSSINTMSLGDEMLLNTFTAIAQEESKAISQNQRLSIVKRMELGIYVDSNAP